MGNLDVHSDEGVERAKKIGMTARENIIETRLWLQENCLEHIENRGQQR